ncbi:hypothetical protein M8C21_030978, partial [Ambrosia artemisiifolia]
IERERIFSELITIFILLWTLNHQSESFSKPLRSNSKLETQWERTQREEKAKGNKQAGVRMVVQKAKEKVERLLMALVLAPRHILCEKQGKINEAYKKLQDGWLSNGDKIAAEYSECPSGKKGGDLGWFPRGKMAGPFQEAWVSHHLGRRTEELDHKQLNVIVMTIK